MSLASFCCTSSRNRLTSTATSAAGTEAGAEEDLDDDDDDDDADDDDDDDEASSQARPLTDARCCCATHEISGCKMWYGSAVFACLSEGVEPGAGAVDGAEFEEDNDDDDDDDDTAFASDGSGSVYKRVRR